MSGPPKDPLTEEICARSWNKIYNQANLPVPQQKIPGVAAELTLVGGSTEKSESLQDLSIQVHLWESKTLSSV